jgi:hypothetical protein
MPGVQLSQLQFGQRESQVVCSRGIDHGLGNVHGINSFSKHCTTNTINNYFTPITTTPTGATTTVQLPPPPKQTWVENNSWSLKPLSCIWCDKQFNNIDQVRLHTRAKHKFNCNDCLKAIAQWADFVRHAEVCKYAKNDISYYTMTFAI